MAISPFLHSLSFFTRRTARESANSTKCSATKWKWKAKQAKQHSKKKSTYKNSSIFNYLIKCILCAIKVPSISTDNDSELCVCVCVWIAVIVLHSLFNAIWLLRSSRLLNAFFYVVHLCGGFWFLLSLHFFVSIQSLALAHPLVCACVCFFHLESINHD